MTTSLVVLAAGLGRRFGGTKQLAEVGPAGEAFCDYAIADARAAGVGRVVMVVRTEIEAMLVEHLRSVHGPDLDLVTVCQDELPPARAKPWGTVHALLAAAPAVDGPFVVANADDYYGPASFALAADCLTRVGPSSAALVAFELGRTVPAEGSVSRGVCQVDVAQLVGIAEHRHIERRDGVIVSGEGVELDPATPVSVNLWCFDRSLLDRLAERFEAFLVENRTSEDAECLLPDEVGALIEAGRLDVEVVSSSETWIGVTNPDDLELARTRLAERGPLVSR